MQFDDLFVSQSPKNNAWTFHLANRKRKACVYTTSHREQARFLLNLFSFVIALHFLEIYPQSVLLKPVFLKKLSFKNVKHNEK